MSRIGVDFYVDLLTELFHGGFELADVSRSDALIFAAEEAEDGGVDFVEAFGFGDEVAVVDNGGGQVGNFEGGLQGVAAAHAPADGADAIFLDVALRPQEGDGGAEVASGTVFGKAAH